MLERPEPDEQLLQTDVAPSDSASSSLCSNAHPPTDMPSSVDQTATKHHQQRPTTCEGLASVVVDIAQSKISSPSQSKLACYPKTQYGKQCRSFQAHWYTKYTWLEYSVQHDAAFCFCCRWFKAGTQCSGGASETFVTVGYRNWQKAVQPGRGLEGHDQSNVHKQSFHAWKVWEYGEQMGKSVAHQLSSTQIAHNRAYVAYVADLIRFLVANEKALRGTSEFLGSDSSGFFLSMMDRDFARDQKLRLIAESIPRNCTYASHDSQNELISMWFQLVQKEIIDRVSQASMYCVMADETRNKNNVEDMCVCIRFIDSKFEAHEMLIDIVALESLRAQSIANDLLRVLETTVGTSRLVAQSYDGASVMSGCKGGVQKLVSDAVGRHVIYIHCFAHRLHLVVLDVLKSSKHVQWVLDICEQLYNFFRRYTVAREHSAVGGQTLKRIMPQRWSGHYDSLCTVLVEYDHIMQTLNVVVSLRIPEALEAAGLVSQLKHNDFLPVAKVTKELLDLLMPLNKAFQSEQIDVGTGLLQLDAVQCNLTALKHELMSDLNVVIDDDVSADMNTPRTTGNASTSTCRTAFIGINVSTDTEPLGTASNVSTRPVRSKHQPKHLLEFVVEIGIRNQQFDKPNSPTSTVTAVASSDSDFQTQSDKEQEAEPLNLPELKLLLINAILTELDVRFGAEQRSVYLAAASLATAEFTPATLAPLVTAAKNAGCVIDEEMLSHEIPIATALLTRRSSNDRSLTLTTTSAAQMLHPPSHANLLTLYKFVRTLAIDTAKAERTFSTVKRLLTDNRRSMTHDRLRHLVVLAHEKQLLRDISIETFISHFRRSTRRLLV